jgi:3-hydroxyisobutyrate dehydrogenase
MAPGSALVCASTVSPALVRRLEREARPRGVDVLDAPVTGAADGARAGTLSIMVGAEPEALERCRPVLAALSSRIFHTGPVGTGSATKLLTNMLWAVHVVALADALSVGTRAGLDPAVLGEAIDASAGGSWVSAHDLPNILRGDDDETFPLALCRKDLRLIAELAEGGAPLAELARERFEAAYERFGPEAGELAVTRL